MLPICCVWPLSYNVNDYLEDRPDDDPNVTMMTITIMMMTECDVLVSGIFHFFGGIGTSIGKNWYRKIVSDRYRTNLVPEKSLGTGIRKKYRNRHRKKFNNEADFRRQHLGILKILKGYRYRISTDTGNFSFQL